MIKLKIVSPEGEDYYSEEVVSITAPTTSGIITVYEDHMPLLTVLEAGELNVEKEDNTVDLSISHGVMQVVRPNEVNVLVESSETADEIDLERALEAKKRAEEYLSKKEHMEGVEFALMQAKLEKELARINLANKVRRKVTSGTSSLNGDK